MTINAEALNIQMKQAGLNQNALAERSGVSAKTIGRILKGGHKSNPATANRIVDALNTTPEALATPPDDAQQRKAEEDMKTMGYHRVSFIISGQTALNFNLVEARYGLSVASVFEAAPLFATLLAEMSLAERRARLAAYVDALCATEAPEHLRCAEIASNNAEEACMSERRSLAANDLSGNTFDEDERKGENDLFVDYLRRASKTFNPAVIGDVDGTAARLDYEIFRDEQDAITNGGYWAEFSLLHRHTRIRDIPEDLRGEDRAVERAEWLAAQVPEAARKAHEDWIASMPSLDDFDLGNTAAAVNDGGQENE